MRTKEASVLKPDGGAVTKPNDSSKNVCIVGKKTVLKPEGGVATKPDETSKKSVHCWKKQVALKKNIQHSGVAVHVVPDPIAGRDGLQVGAVSTRAHH